jgi:hypothetical protein
MIANTLNPTQYGDDVLDNLLAGAEDIFSQIKSSGRAFDYALRNMKTVPNPIPERLFTCCIILLSCPNS